MTLLRALAGSSFIAMVCASQAHAQTALSATGGASAPVEASRQDTPSSATQTATSKTEQQAGDIIVTANRRAENLQNVPIAITVVGGDALKANNFTSITDAQYLAPSLKFTPTPQSSSFAIRGVGSQAFDLTVEQSVGVSLDDVIQTLPRALSLNTLADVERIEVLRGPQGTLFGKNTSAGLLSIITRRPVLGAYSMEGHVQYGSRNELQAYDIVNVPLGDALAARFRVAYQYREPVLQNLSTGMLPNNRDYEFNGKLLWQPSATFSVYAIGDYQHSFGDPGLATLRSYGVGTFAPAVGNTFIRTQTSALGIVPSPTNTQVAYNSDNYQVSETYSGQITATLGLGAHTVTSITGYKHLTYTSALEADSTPLTVLDNNIGNVSGRQITQEVRLASPTGRTLEYVIGGFYYDQRLDAAQQQSGGLGFLPNNFPIQVDTGAGGLFHSLVQTTNYAAFGQATLRPVQALRLILGLRYTHDTVDSSAYTSAIPNVCGREFLLAGICHASSLPSAPIGGKTSRGALTGRGGVEFDIAPHVMIYATVSRGYKGAGVTSVGGRVIDINPETVWSEEVGLKSQFFDRQLTLNIAGFHSQYTNFQTQVFDPSVPPNGQFVTGNAGGLRTQGVEVEGNARPFRGLVISGGFSYTDATFTDYQPACYPTQTAAIGCTLPGPTFNASGTRLPNSPRWTYTLSGGYETPEFRGMKAFVNANYAYRSSVIFGVGNPNTFQDGYGILNLSAGVATADGHARVSVFTRNLADKRFASFIYPTFFDTGGYTQVLSDSAFRRVGVALDFRF